MTISASTRHSIAIQGVGAVVSNFDKFESGTDPKRAVGFKLVDAQGSEYVWSHFGAACNRGTIVGPDISVSGLTDQDNIILAPASCVNTTDGTIGSYYVEITLATQYENYYAGGKLLISNDTGEGYTYDIVGNTATGNPASGTFRVQLAQPLQVAVDATSDFAIAGGLYSNLKTIDMSGVGGTDPIVSGVSCTTQAAGDFGWIQTRGVCGVLTEGTLVRGNGVCPSLTTAGAVTVASSSTTGRLIGTVVEVGATTEHSLVDLKI